MTVHQDRKLRAQRQNWLIVSLAIADLLVGLLVMPLTLIYEVIGEWKMGKERNSFLLTTNASRYGAL